MKPKQELKIFKATSIEILKSLYFKSKVYLIDKSIFEYENNNITLVATKYIEPIVKKSLNKLEKNLRIFKKANIETLKSSYYESIGIV